MNHTSTSEKHKERGIGQFLVYVLISIFFVGAAFKWNARQSVDNVSLKGTTYITSDEIKLLYQSDTTSKQQSFDLAQTRDLVLKHPFVRNASIEHINSRNVAITITERKPIAVILNSNGTLKYVDDENVILPYRVINGMADLPLLRGITLNSTDIIDTVQLQQCVEILRLLSGDTLRNVGSDISEVIYNRQNNTVRLKTSESNAVILLGSVETAKSNLNKLSYVYDYCTKQNNTRIQGIIDLRWKDKVIIKNG